MDSWNWEDDYQSATLEQTTPHGVFRAVIERDEQPEEPEFDAGCPVVQIENNFYRTSAVMLGYGSDSEVHDGLPRNAAGIIMYFHERTGRDMRDAIETFERYLNIFHGGALVEYGPNNYTDYQYVAWLEGDVYGIRVERATSFDEDGEPDQWTETENGTCWGFYGEDCAKAEAEATLDAEITDMATAMLPLGT